jgi:hypothetical protein
MRGSWIVIALLLFLVAGVAGFVLWLMRGMVLEVLATPQRITARELGDKGPGGNRNVAITDYELGPPTVDRPRNRACWGVWFPVFPTGEAGAGRAARVFLFVPAETEAAADAVRKKPPEAKGVVRTGIWLHSWSPPAGALAPFPPQDGAKAWMVHAGPHSRTLVYAVGGTGIGLALLGVAALVAGAVNLGGDRHTIWGVPSDLPSAPARVSLAASSPLARYVCTFGSFCRHFRLSVLALGAAAVAVGVSVLVRSGAGVAVGSLILLLVAAWFATNWFERTWWVELHNGGIRWGDGKGTHEGAWTSVRDVQLSDRRITILFLIPFSWREARVELFFGDSQQKAFDPSLEGYDELVPGIQLLRSEARGPARS